jgi:hypothetical protein
VNGIVLAPAAVIDAVAAVVTDAVVVVVIGAAAEAMTDGGERDHDSSCAR